MTADIFMAVYILVVMPLLGLIGLRQSIASGRHEQVRQAIRKWEETDPLDREYWFRLR